MTLPSSVVASKQHPEVLINPPVITISVGFYFILRVIDLFQICVDSLQVWPTIDVCAVIYFLFKLELTWFFK